MNKLCFSLARARIIIIAFALYAVACTGARSSPTASPEYSFGFHNATNEAINDIVVDWGPTRGRHKEDKFVLSAGGVATIGSEPRPIPKAFTVTWVAKDGRHNQRVERPKIEPDEDQFSGTIWFKFTETKVEVVPMTYEEQHRRAAAKQQYYP